MAASLGGGWWARRRFVKELEHHLEDCVADLRAAGMSEDAAVSDAMARLGDVDVIVGAARVARSARRLSWRRVSRVPIAWVAVGAMSIVTLVAAEIPPASGAKVPASQPKSQSQRIQGNSQSDRIQAKSQGHPHPTCRSSRKLARGRSSS